MLQAFMGFNFEVICESIVDSDDICQGDIPA